MCSRSCRRPRGWTSRARSSCWPTAAGSSSSASRRTRARPSAGAQRERLLELLARTRAYYERCLWESEEAARAREYLRGRGLGEEILREFRVGYAPSAWDRVLTRLAARRVLRGASCTRPAWPSARSRTGDRMTASARGSCSRWPTCAGACSASARARWAMGRARSGRRPKYLNTADNDVYHKGQHLYGADLARAHAARAGAGDPVRGLHRRDRAAPGGHAQRGRPDGHRADRRAGGGARADGADRAAGARRRQRRPGGDAARRRAGRRAQARAARGRRCRQGTDPAELRAARGRRGDRARRSRSRCRSCASASSASCEAATTAAPRAATGCSTSCGRCSRCCRRARCGWS